MKYDFAGWATRNNIRCSDGRTIMQDAFKECDGTTVPLVWNHDHNNPTQVLGHALLENRNEGVYAYCSFNDTPAGKNSKELVKHGDIVSLSIYANRLKQQGSNVLHGAIREVSLVLAGANPGALIDNVIAHGEFFEDEAVIFTGEGITLAHADDDEPDDDKNQNPPAKSKDDDGGDETVQDVYNTLSDKQKKVVQFLIGSAVERALKGSKGAKDDDDSDDAKHSDTIGGDMKYNMFAAAADTETDNDVVITHSEMQAIFADGKRMGSLKAGVLEHGIEQIDWLFPEAKNLDIPPVWITRPQEWVKTFMGGVGHSPFSRVKSMMANLTEDEARARGYIKGHFKKEQVFSLLRRSTQPTTIYKKQKLDRDDVVDITDFDVVGWIKGEMRGQLDEEIARAALIGDGRDASDEDKIDELNIRPIWTDADLFTIKALITLPAATTENERAKIFIRSCIKARKQYRGSGSPTLFTTEDMLTSMLLIEDLNGRIIYDTEQKLATALRVSKIVTVPVMEGVTRDVDGVTRNLDGIIVNLSDYNIGADKGGAVNMFDDFDIDYNAQKYLIETRCSGALVKPFSAIVVESVDSATATVPTLTVGTMTEAFVEARLLGYTTHRSGTAATDTFTGDGSTKAFTLAHTPAGGDLAQVTVDGEETTAYTVSGTTLTFGTAPANGDAVVAKYHYIG